MENIDAQKAGFKTISDTVESVASVDTERHRSRAEAFKAQTDFNKSGMESADSSEEKLEFARMQNESYRHFQESTDADAERSHGTFRGALTIAGKALLYAVSAVAAIGTGAYFLSKKKSS